MLPRLGLASKKGLPARRRGATLMEALVGLALLGLLISLVVWLYPILTPLLTSTVLKWAAGIAFGAVAVYFLSRWRHDETRMGGIIAALFAVAIVGLVACAVLPLVKPESYDYWTTGKWAGLIVAAFSVSFVVLSLLLASGNRQSKGAAEAPPTSPTDDGKIPSDGPMGATSEPPSQAMPALPPSQSSAGKTLLPMRVEESPETAQRQRGIPETQPSSSQTAIDAEKEERLQEAVERWEEEHDGGNDLTPEALCPDWSEVWLAELDARIRRRKEVKGEVDDIFKPPQDWLRLRQGDRVPGTDYRLDRYLGGGRFGDVWLVKNLDMGTEAVFKFCRPIHLDSLKQERDVLRRIQRESNREGFVKILDTRISEFPQFVAFEYVPGGTLADLMKSRFDEGRVFAPAEAGGIMLQLARALAVAHTLDEPVVHRDMKPENILVARADCSPPQVKITDFGVGGIVRAAARRTQAPMTVHGYTEGYASPEQLADPSRKVASDDVHALGIIWYQLLSGQRIPFRPSGSSWKADLAQQGSTEEQLLLLESCFEPDRRRPTNAQVLAEKLERLFAG